MGVSHAHPKSNLAVANRRSAKVGLCKEARTPHYTLCGEVLLKQQQQQQAKYGPYLAVFFVIKDKAKITNVTKY